MCDGGDPDGRYCGARASSPGYGLHFSMGDNCVLPPRVLGLGCQRMGVQMGRSRLRRHVLDISAIGSGLTSRLHLGGGPVEIGSGVGGLAYSWILGRRQEKELLNFRPHNVSMVGLGSE